MRSVVAAALLVIGAIAAPSTAARAQQKTFLVARDAVPWLAFGLASAGLTRADSRIAHWFQDSVRQHDRTMSRVATAFTHVHETTLTLGGLATYGIARLARARTVEDVALHATQAVFVASVSNQVIRGPLGRSRPDVTGFDDPYDFHFMKGFSQFNYRAFPSIHASSSFAAATVVVSETRRRNPRATWWVAPIAYGVAAGPAYARLYLGKHWASDILMGAFVGTFYGVRIADYAHAHPDNRVDRFFLRGHQGERMALSYSVQF